MSIFKEIGVIAHIEITRAVARALIGGVYIHIFRSCPTSFFEIKLFSKEVSRAEPEYMNIHPPN